MAVYHCSIKHIQRSKGRSALAAAAYRACEKLIDHRTDYVYDYRRKKHLAAKGILLPSGAPARFADRETLWNEVEICERQWNGQTAREIELALPKELSKEQNTALLKEYAQTFVDIGMIADYAYHDVPSNPNAHILLTMKNVTPEGFGKKNRNWNAKPLAEQWRKTWADLTNKYLAEAKIDQRVDHRSYKRQNIDKIPSLKEGPAVTAMRRRGKFTRVSAENEKRAFLNAEADYYANRERLLQQIAIAKEQEADAQEVSAKAQNQTPKKNNYNDYIYGWRHNAETGELERYKKPYVYKKSQVTIAPVRPKPKEGEEQKKTELSEQKPPMQAQVTDAQLRAIDWLNEHITDVGEWIYMYFESPELENEIFEACCANGIPTMIEDNELAINRAGLVAAGGTQALAQALTNAQEEQKKTAQTNTNRHAVTAPPVQPEKTIDLDKAAAEAQQVAHVKSQKRVFRNSRRKKKNE